MLLKWISCQVGVEKKEPFSKAQQEWNKIQECKGFLGQIGGWNKRDLNRATIIALWENEEDYRAFMEHSHDEIYEQTGQVGTFESIHIQTFDVLNNLSQKDHLESLTNATVLRITRCKAIPGKPHLFKELQEQLSNHSGAKHEGLLGLCLADRDDILIVVSFWDHIRENYTVDDFKELLGEIKPERYFSQIASTLIHIEPKWLVKQK